jgi:hypothetical protein
MLEGGCLCGAVRFAIDGRISPLQFCHCYRCQRVTGGPFMAAVAVRREALRWTAGAALVRQHQLAVRDAPPPYRTAFCSQCGAQVPIDVESRAFAVVPAAALDDQSALRPFRHIFVAQNPAWYAITDDLPRFDAHVPPEQRLPT